MKKLAVLLILSVGCSAFSLAQDAVDISPSTQPVVTAPSDIAAAVDNQVSMEETPAEPVQSDPVVETTNSAVEKQPLNTAPDSAAVSAENMPAVNENDPAVNEETAAADVDQIGITDDLTAGVNIAGGLVSISLKDVELKDVIRMFSRLSNANIIIPDLQQTQQGEQRQQGPQLIDVNLENVEWKPALQAILDTHSLELFEKIPDSEVYSIREKLPPAQAPQTTRTFILNYADIDSVATMIRQIVGGQGQVFSYQQGNSVVVKTTQDIMNDVEQVINRIDKPRAQVLIEARIMELSDQNRNARGVAFDWANILEGVPSTVRGNPLEGDLFFNALAGLTEADFDNIGGLGTLTLNAADMDVTLKALQQSGLARVVSNPRVVVANGETANIQILKKVPRVDITRTIEQNANGTPTAIYTTKQDDDGTDDNTGRKRYAEYEFGIRLAVTPTVYTEDNIAVAMVPIITRESQTGNIELPVDPENPDGPQNTFYAVDEKRVETTFVLGSKRTAVIGGLTETQNNDIERKIPLLGSIPLIRHLFTYKELEEVQTENIIFVTVALEDGLHNNIEEAVSKSPLTRQQMVRDENNQLIQDRQVEVMKVSEKARVDEEIRKAESAANFDKVNHKVRTPFWDAFRP